MHFVFKNKEKIFIIGLFVVLGFFILHQSVLAATFTPQVGIPGSKEYQPGENVGVTPETFADYLTTFYNWAVGAIIVIGIVMIMFAGFQWVMAAGSAPKISAAKERIFSAIIGILLAVGSYALLNFINPSLTRFRSLSLNPVTKVGRPDFCTIYIEDDGECIEAGDKYQAYKDGTERPFGYTECRAGRGCPGTTTICCKKEIEALSPKFRCLLESQTCKDTVPPSIAMNIEVCYSIYGVKFECPEKAPNIECCGYYEGVNEDDVCSFAVQGENTNLQSCSVTLGSNVVFGYCWNGKCSYCKKIREECSPAAGGAECINKDGKCGKSFKGKCRRGLLNLNYVCVQDD